MSIKINILKPDHHYIVEAIDHLDGATRDLNSVFSLDEDEMVKRSKAHELIAKATNILQTLELHLENRMVNSQINF
jgi:hypothetical protein